MYYHCRSQLNIAKSALRVLNAQQQIEQLERWAPPHLPVLPRAFLVLPHDLLQQLCMPYTASGRPAATMRNALSCLYTTRYPRYSNAINCRDTKRREAIDLEASCNNIENSAASNGGAHAASAAQAGANRSNGGAAPPQQQQQQHQQQVGTWVRKLRGVLYALRQRLRWGASCIVSEGSAGGKPAVQSFCFRRPCYLPALPEWHVLRT